MSFMILSFLLSIHQRLKIPVSYKKSIKMDCDTAKVTLHDREILPFLNWERTTRKY